MTTGEALKRFRHEYKLNQTEVAKAVGLVPQSYYRYETGKLPPPSTMIITLAKTYNVSADYLLGLSDSPRPSGFDETLVREAKELKQLLRRFVSEGTLSI